MQTSEKFLGNFPINFRKISSDNIETLKNLEYFRLILLTFWGKLKFKADFEKTEEKIGNYF